MKKLSILFVTSLFVFSLFSCTPQALENSKEMPQACCGDDYNIPPAPDSAG